MWHGYGSTGMARSWQNNQAVFAIPIKAVVAPYFPDYLHLEETKIEDQRLKTWLNAQALRSTYQGGVAGFYPKNKGAIVW